MKALDPGYICLAGMRDSRLGSKKKISISLQTNSEEAMSGSQERED